MHVYNVYIIHIMLALYLWRLSGLLFQKCSCFCKEQIWNIPRLISAAIVAAECRKRAAVGVTLKAGILQKKLFLFLLKTLPLFPCSGGQPWLVLRHISKELV